jgi:hypothetical protein
LSIGLEPAPELLEGSKDRPFFHTNAPQQPEASRVVGHPPVGTHNDQVIFFVSVLFCFENNSLIAKISERSNKISGIYSKK